MSPKVFRVSVRGAEGFVGHLTSFFNVPAIFGAVPYQSRNYLGVDCAEVLVAAFYKWKGRPMRKDHCVQSLEHLLPKTVEFDMKKGKPHKRIAWGKSVRTGDFLAVRYAGRQRYQHIGAPFRDVNGNGILDEDDLILHAGPYPLHFSHLREGNFDGHVVVLRPSVGHLESKQDNWLVHNVKALWLRIR
ncbi:hypothetical protein ACFL2Q_11110 [Thermodesulfobacteriota bacterium]